MLKIEFMHGKTDEFRAKQTALTTERGIALVLALIITTVVFLLSASTLYVITQGTGISGPVYKTCWSAADGSVKILVDAIENKFYGQPISAVFTNQNAFNTCLDAGVLSGGAACQDTIILPGAMGSYQANVSVTRLFYKIIPGSAGGIEKTKGPKESTVGSGIFFRVVTTVRGPNNTSCENAVVYRHVL